MRGLKSLNMTLVDLLEAMQGVSLLYAEDLFERSIAQNVQAAVYTFLRLAEDSTQPKQEILQATLENLVSDSVLSIQQDIRRLMLCVITPCTRRQSEMLPVVAANLQLSATQGVYPPPIAPRVVDAVLAVGRQSKAFARLGRIPGAAEAALCGAPSKRHAATKDAHEPHKAPRLSAAIISGASSSAVRGGRPATGPISPETRAAHSVKSLPLQCLKVFLDTDWFLDAVLRETLDLVLDQAYDRIQRVSERLMGLCETLPAQAGATM